METWRSRARRLLPGSWPLVACRLVSYQEREESEAKRSHPTKEADLLRRGALGAQAREGERSRVLRDDGRPRIGRCSDSRDEWLPSGGGRLRLRESPSRLTFAACDPPASRGCPLDARVVSCPIDREPRRRTRPAASP